MLVKQANAFRPMELLAWFAIVGMIGLWTMTFALENGQGAAFAAAEKPLVIGAILYSAIGASLFAHSTYYWLLQRLPVSIVASSAPLTTIFAVLFGVAFLGEPFGWRFVIGGLMTISGVALVLLRSAKKQDIRESSSEPGIVQ